MDQGLRWKTHRDPWWYITAICSVQLNVCYFTVHTTNPSYDFQPDIGEMCKLSLKYWLKHCINISHHEMKPSLRQLLQSCDVHALSHRLLIPFVYLPNLARLSCTPPLTIKTPLTPSRPPQTPPLWPGFVQRVLDNEWPAFTSGPIHGTIVGLPELDKLIGD